MDINLILFVIIFIPIDLYFISYFLIPKTKTQFCLRDYISRLNESVTFYTIILSVCVLFTLRWYLYLLKSIIVYLIFARVSMFLKPFNYVEVFYC